jgi:hypothetical protein
VGIISTESVITPGKTPPNAIYITTAALVVPIRNIRPIPFLRKVKVLANTNGGRG